MQKWRSSNTLWGNCTYFCVCVYVWESPERPKKNQPPHRFDQPVFRSLCWLISGLLEPRMNYRWTAGSIEGSLPTHRDPKCLCVCLYVCVNMRVQPRWILRGALICLWSGSRYSTVIFISRQPVQHVWLCPLAFLYVALTSKWRQCLWRLLVWSIPLQDCLQNEAGCNSYSEPRFSFEVLTPSISILCYLVVLLHYISEGNGVYRARWWAPVFSSTSLAKVILASLQSLISWAGKIWCMSSLGKNRASAAWWISLPL